MLITRSRVPAALALGLALLGALVIGSVAVGAYPLALGDIARVLWGELGGAAPATDSARAVVLEIRGPRIAAALAVGLALGVAG
ncbi:MAG: iron chelate uptake ABC transporter family permease subunit, partial [Pseudomonadota bacterium]|nr:iron chelate uptake ABC transporter family permease subunit [Pseudomonadota bacterium]